MNNDLNADQPRAGRQSQEIADMHPAERFELMFEVELSVPKWRELAGVRGIKAKDVTFLSAEDCGKVIAESCWVAELEWFGDYQYEKAETEEMAIKTLMHRLKLGELKPE